MSVKSKIEWTDQTWNPTTGCDQISPGCDACYALTMARRLKAMGSPKYQLDGDPRTSGPGFGIAMHEDVLVEPLSWRSPRTVFVDSMSDLGHARVTSNFLVKVWAVMAAASQHTFQVLTKRPRRFELLLGMESFRDAVLQLAAAEYGGEELVWPLPNVWLGTSIESDEHCRRAAVLVRTPAAVRFLSLEPLIGGLATLDLTGIDWVIAGGESGQGARPMHPAWVRDLRDRCQAVGMPFFFKQWGSWLLVGEDDPDRADIDGLYPGRPRYRVGVDGAVGELGSWTCGDAVMMRARPAVAGRELDGRLWDEMPATRAAAEVGSLAVAGGR